jgi:hypothetical protein
MSYRLVAPSGHCIELQQKPIIVGSDPAADVPIVTGLGVAAQHFRLAPQGGRHHIELLSAADILAINGMPVREAVLNPGDVIHAGQLELTYRVPEEQILPPAVMKVEPQQPLVRPPTSAFFTDPLPIPAVPAPRVESAPVPAGELRLFTLPPKAGEEEEQKLEIPSSDADEEPRKGFRKPVKMPVPAQPETAPLDAAVPSAMRHVNRVLANQEWAKEQVAKQQNKQVGEEDLGSGLRAGMILMVVCAVLWVFLPSPFTGRMGMFYWAGVSAAMGFWIGRTVRVQGNGASARFGYWGAALALFAVLAGAALKLYLLGAEVQGEGVNAALVRAKSSSLVSDLLTLVNGQALICYCFALGAAFTAGNNARE